MLEKNQINLKLPIIPEKGIGDIHLKMNISNFYSIIEKDYNTKSSNWKYRLGNNAVIGHIFLIYKNIIELVFDSSTGTLISIFLSIGYEGKLFNTIRVGDNVSKLSQLREMRDKDWEVHEGWLLYKSSLLFKIGEDYEDYLEIEEIGDRKIKTVWLRV